MRFTQAIQRAAQTRPTHTSTIFRDRVRCWQQTLDRVQRLAAGLRGLGVVDGARVAILAMNSDRYLEAMYGVAWAGGVFAPLNTRWSVPELTHALRECQARTVILDDSFSHLMTELRARTDVTHFIHIGDEQSPTQMIAVEELISKNEICSDAERHDNDVCGIFYTGGTTGHPKGVMLSNANISFASLNWLACLEVSRETIYLHVPGFFHLGGASPAFATTLAGGTNVVLPKFEAVPVMEAIRRYRVNYTLLVPVMLNALINDPAVTKYDLSSMRRCHYGGSPMPEAVLRKAMSLLPTWTFFQGYGLTETSAVLTTLDWRQHALEGPLAKKLTSAGQVSPGWELKIADKHGEEVPRGQIGEVVARGEALMLGYWANEEATRAVIKDGWFHTGDGAYMDEDGFIFIVDRVKDMIISGGENIYSTEVENAIYKHPAVRECAVIGIPDEVWGEAVHAVVVAHDGDDLSTNEIIKHCHTLIAGYKCPRSVEITTVPLPTSPTGKITKKVLRDKFWVGKERNVN